MTILFFLTDILNKQIVRVEIYEMCIGAVDLGLTMEKIVMKRETIRETLITFREFKRFWKKKGPYKYALTSIEYPPVLLEPEEWLFSDNAVDILKELMRWKERKMKIVPAPFNKNKKNILKPETLSPWKINNFPEEWKGAVCKSFTPVGHLTESVTAGREIIAAGVKSMESAHNDLSIKTIENLFFESLEMDIEKIGYILLKPDKLRESGDAAFIMDYLEEWETDEKDG